MDFGNLTLVEKTFTRTVNNPRGQSYEGIKFRRFETNKGGKTALEEQFEFSENLFQKLGLETYALAQANAPDGGVLLLVVEDQTEIQPIAKFMRRSKKKNGDGVYGKGRTFSNEFVTDGLINNGVLDKDTKDNQYLTVEDARSLIQGEIPSVVKGIYRIVVDSSVGDEDDDSADAVEAQATTQAAPASAPVQAAASNDDF